MVQQDCLVEDAHEHLMSLPPRLRVPLLVEVWHRDPTSGDQLMGRASLQLSPLLSCERSRLSAAGEPSWRQTHQDRVAVVAAQR